MSKIVKIVLALAVLGIIGGIYAYMEFNRKPASTSEKESIGRFMADSLAETFEANDSVATLEYAGKIVELEGVVEEATNDGGVMRIRLKGSEMSNVICQLEGTDSTQLGQFKPGATVCLKGQCNTYQKVEMLPGGDLLLSNCVLTDYRK